MIYSKMKICKKNFISFLPYFQIQMSPPVHLSLDQLLDILYSQLIKSLARLFIPYIPQDCSSSCIREMIPRFATFLSSSISLKHLSQMGKTELGTISVNQGHLVSMITILMRKILGGYNYKYAITLAAIEVMIDSNPMINGH